MAVRKLWPIAVGSLLVLSACGGGTGSERTVSQPLSSPSTVRQSGEPGDAQQPVRVDLAPGEVEVVREQGSGEAALAAFRSGSYRVLISCQGEPLRIRDAQREIAVTKCDGVTLDARVASAAGVKHLTVVTSAATAWAVRVARTGDDWFTSQQPG